MVMVSLRHENVLRLPQVSAPKTNSADNGSRPCSRIAATGRARACSGRRGVSSAQQWAELVLEFPRAAFVSVGQVPIGGPAKPFRP